ncbi:MAG TPA: Uma2 family endonuclease [Steroidobacteraceae bacterium]|nr:Uma2 family endonuclease [Steroidobacteraceae bacterium]
MSAAFLPSRMRFSIDRYHKMVAAGVLTESDRVELIEGEILEMAPIGTPHSATTALLYERFTFALQRAATISAGGPLVLGDFSEPEPDLMLLLRREDFYRGQHPVAADVLLLIEISDSSLAFDLGVKRALYARHGIREYWVVDLNGHRVHVHREPREAGYASTQVSGPSESLSLLAFPALQLPLHELF